MSSMTCSWEFGITLIVREACRWLWLKHVGLCQVAWSTLWARWVTGPLANLCRDAIWCLNRCTLSQERAWSVSVSFFHSVRASVGTRRMSRSNSIASLRSDRLTTFKLETSCNAMIATIDSTITSMNCWVCSWSDRRLALLDATTEAVQISLADKHVFVGFLKFKHNSMNSVNGCLESLKVCNDGHEVLVDWLDLELVILEVRLHLIFVRLCLNMLVDRAHIKLIPDVDHPLVPAHELLFQFDP